MTLEQTITIPADRRVVIDVPETFSSSRISIILLDLPKGDDPETQDAITIQRQKEAIKRCWGIAQHIGFSSDDLLRNRREDLALEEAKYRRLLPEDKR
jgi:hypothetical protein